MVYLEGYYYELMKVNAQCNYQRRSWVTDEAFALITLQECFRLVESKQGNSCAERIVEWGNSNSFEPSSTGYCLCSNDICTEELSTSDGGEHLLRFIPEDLSTCSGNAQWLISAKGKNNSICGQCITIVIQRILFTKTSVNKIKPGPK